MANPPGYDKAGGWSGGNPPGYDHSAFNDFLYKLNHDRDPSERQPDASPAGPDNSFKGLDGIMLKAAQKHGIPMQLLKAVGIQETGLGQSSVYDSKRGVSRTAGNAGHGIWQLDPASGASQSTLDQVSQDPAFAANYAAGMLSNLMKRYGGDIRSTLAAYNAGTAHSKVGQQYADSVIKTLRGLGYNG